MKQMKKALSMLGLISVGLCLSGCASSMKPTQTSPNAQNYALNSFNKVVLSGDVRAKVSENQPQNEIVAFGDTNTLQSVTVQQKGSAVYVNSSSPTPVTVNVERAASSTPLSIVSSGSSKSTFEGNIFAQNITASGSTVLNLKDLSTSHLDVTTSGNARVTLAGVVTHLDVTASGSSIVNGKDLDVDDSYVMASGSSSVRVKVKKALGTQAFGSATIYYYKDPEFAGIYLNSSGSALRMKGISGSPDNLKD